MIKMIGEMPKFVDSPYFVDEPGNWHLKDGAPEEVVKEFNAFMKAQGLIHEKPPKKAKSYKDLK